MIRNRWLFAVGTGLLVFGAALFVSSHPRGDMIWEWPWFGIGVWVAGMVILALSVRPRVE